MSLCLTCSQLSHLTESTKCALAIKASRDYQELFQVFKEDLKDRLAASLLEISKEHALVTFEISEV